VRLLLAVGRRRRRKRRRRRPFLSVSVVGELITEMQQPLSFRGPRGPRGLLTEASSDRADTQPAKQQHNKHKVLQ